MKKLYLLLVSLFTSILLWADPKPIDWDPNHGNGNGDRMPVSVPSAFHDGNSIILYSHSSIIAIQVIVKDELNDIVYSGTISLLPNTPYILNIGDVEAGLYTLEVSYGSISLSGSFEIDG